MIQLAINWSAAMSNIGQFILSFSILVVLHEMGHFLPAKWFGCRVEKFYLFFDPWFSIFKKKKGETEYGIGWIPLGGYVKISGMVDESMDKEQMKLPPQPWEFRSKPAWQRLIIMIGGVVVNFLLAFAIFAGILFTWGEERLPVKNMTYGLVADSLALSIGMQDGDIIKSINGKPLVYINNLPKDLMLSENATMIIDRNGVDTSIAIPEGFISKLTKSQLKGFVSPRIPVIVDSISSEIEFKEGSFQKGDRLIGIGDKSFAFYNEFDKAKKELKGQIVPIQFLRNNSDTMTATVQLKADGGVGFFAKTMDKLFETEKIEYSLLQAIPAGYTYGVERLKDYVTGIRLLFTSKEHKVNENLGSVVSIGKMFGGYWDWQRFWMMTALFSIILAFMNILPIPALDGGHALFTIVEMVSGRKPSDKFMEYAQMLGMFLLLGLMAYALGLDILRLFK